MFCASEPNVLLCCGVDQIQLIQELIPDQEPTQVQLKPLVSIDSFLEWFESHESNDQENQIVIKQETPSKTVRNKRTPSSVKKENKLDVCLLHLEDVERGSDLDLAKIRKPMTEQFQAIQQQANLELLESIALEKIREMPLLMESGDDSKETVRLNKILSGLDYVQFLMLMKEQDKKPIKEETVEQLIQTLKNLLEDTLAPYLRMDPSKAAMNIVREICHKTGQCLRHFTFFQSQWSDATLVPLLFMTLHIFYWPSTKIYKECNYALILHQAMDLLVRLFQSEGHRYFILEEIGSNLPKMDQKYRTKQSKSINLSSFLILRLCQSLVYNPTTEQLLQQFKMDPNDFESLKESIGKNIEHSLSHLSYLLSILLNRSVQKKSELASDYKTFLDHLLNDFLVLMGDPQMPLLFNILPHLLVWTSQVVDSRADAQLKAVLVQWQGNLGLEIAKHQKFQDSLENLLDNADLQQWLLGITHLDPKIFKVVFSCLVPSLDQKTAHLLMESQATHEIQFQQLYSLCPINIQNTLVRHLQSDTVQVRVRALKCLDEIWKHTSMDHQVHRLVLERLDDPASHVRDVAMDMLSRTLLESSILEQSLKIFMDRTQDSSTLVRKRVIKILHNIAQKYLTSKPLLMSSVMERLIGLLQDEETTVQDLALKTLKQVWFSDQYHPSIECMKTVPIDPLLEKIDIKPQMHTVLVQMIQNAFSRERDQDLADLLGLLVKLVKRTPSHPTHIVQMQLLLDFQSQDQQLQQNVCSRYLQVILMHYPHLEFPDTGFQQKLESKLLLFVQRGSQQVLEQAVPLLVLLNAQKAKLILDRLKRDLVSQEYSIKKLRCLLLVGLLSRYLSVSQENFALLLESTKEYHSMENGSIVVSGWTHLVLGEPNLFAKQESLGLIHQIFTSSSLLGKQTLLTCFIDYLKEQTETVDYNVNLLMGRGEAFNGSGIASSILQTHLNDILDCCLDQHLPLSLSGFECLELGLEQGLVHPLLCIPTLVCLETHPILSQKAFKEHQKLVDKHRSFIHSKPLLVVQKVYEYQQQMSFQHPQPLFHYFGLMKTKKRTDTLKQMVNLIDQKSQLSKFILLVLGTIEMSSEESELINHLLAVKMATLAQEIDEEEPNDQDALDCSLVYWMDLVRKRSPMTFQTLEDIPKHRVEQTMAKVQLLDDEDLIMKKRRRRE
ncbi:sister chromatid cohesion C-terminus-domain-containing protein [Gorgonomyces haynaldii]|nr:sister chromatid cohesion C-terminus-domain-containing protein [Gorgonomyces haynaldii]